MVASAWASPGAFMVVQSTMEEVRLCQVAPPPQLPQAPPPAPHGTQDDGDQSDPEVMQVTGEGMAVNLRHKKQRINGAAQLGITWAGTAAGGQGGDQSEERERPMSWEGELSEDEEEEDGEQDHQGGILVLRPGNSPMLVERDEGASSPISLTTTPGDSKSKGAGDKPASQGNVPDTGSNHVIAYVAPVSPAPSTPYGGGSPAVPAFQDRQAVHNSSFGEVSTSSRPPGTMLGGAFQPPSVFGESSSPILTPRPTSSSSSRSSYSPTQSPLLGQRGACGPGGGPYTHPSHQSPLPHRHGVASSDGSVYSPSSSPLQVRNRLCNLLWIVQSTPFGNLLLGCAVPEYALESPLSVVPTNP